MLMLTIATLKLWMLRCTLGGQQANPRGCRAPLYNIQCHAVDIASAARLLVCQWPAATESLLDNGFVYFVACNAVQILRFTDTVLLAYRSYFIARILVRQIQNRGKVEGDVREDDDDGMFYMGSDGKTMACFGKYWHVTFSSSFQPNSWMTW